MAKRASATCRKILSRCMKGKGGGRSKPIACMRKFNRCRAR